MKREVKKYAEDAVRESGGGCLAFVLFMGLVAFIAIICASLFLLASFINDLIKSII